MRAQTTNGGARRALAMLAIIGLAAPMAASTYTVKAGDTLSGIANRHGTSVSALAKANGISNPNHIVVGTTLRIGGRADQTAPSGGGSDDAPTRYRVRRGDTLSSIAGRHGTTVARLIKLNKISNPNLIVAGTTLIVSRTGGGGGGGDTAAAPAPTSTVHVVRSGETLSRIAARYSTTALAIAEANDLRSIHLIRIGQRLKVPTGSGGSTTAAPTGRDVPRRLLDNPSRLVHAASFNRWAAHWNVPHDLLKSMNYLESGWQNHVVSHTGAMGIGQIMPGTADFINRSLIPGPDLDPRNPDDNIQMSARFLRYLLDLTDGDVSLALAGYYQGLASVRRHGFFSSTHDYVAGILALRKAYTWAV